MEGVPAANALGQVESVYPAITYDALLLNRAPPYIYRAMHATVYVLIISDIYTIHSGIRGPIQVHLGGGRSRATTRICIWLILLGWVLARCVVILSWCLVPGVYVLFGGDSFILSEEFRELDSELLGVLSVGWWLS